MNKQVDVDLAAKKQHKLIWFVLYGYLYNHVHLGLLNQNLELTF